MPRRHIEHGETVSEICDSRHFVKSRGELGSAQVSSVNMADAQSPLPPTVYRRSVSTAKHYHECLSSHLQTGPGGVFMGAATEEQRAATGERMPPRRKVSPGHTQKHHTDSGRATARQPSPTGRRHPSHRADGLGPNLEVVPESGVPSRSGSAGRRRITPAHDTQGFFIDTLAASEPPVQRLVPPPMVRKPYIPMKRQGQASIAPPFVDLLSLGERSPALPKPAIYRVATSSTIPEEHVPAGVRKLPASNPVTHHIIGHFEGSPSTDAPRGRSAVPHMKPGDMHPHCRRSATPPRRDVDIITGRPNLLAAGYSGPSPVRRDHKLRGASPWRLHPTTALLDWPGGDGPK
jgi:hypothetical protein